MEAVRTRIDGASAEEWDGHVVEGGVSGALREVVDAFERRAYSAFASVWMNPDDGDEGGALLVRCPGHFMLVIGGDPMAEHLRRLLTAECRGWTRQSLPETLTLLEVAEPILGHRAYNMLTRAGFRTIEEVAATPDAALLGVRNLGVKSLSAIHDAVAANANGTLGSPAAVGQDRHVEHTAHDVEELSNRQLLSLWAATLRDLRRRGVVRTFNNPIGDIAEELVCRHYGGERGSFTQKTWDVRVGEDLLQVKAIRMTGSRGRRNLSPIRSDDGYTAVIVVVFTDDMRVKEALRVPREVVNDLFHRRAHVNGRIITLTPALRQHPDVTTLSLSDAALDEDAGDPSPRPPAIVDCLSPALSPQRCRRGADGAVEPGPRPG